MVKNPPKTMKDVLGLPGVGESKVKQFGELFIKACMDIAGKKVETSG